MTDLSRIKEDESIFKVSGTNCNIDLCLVDGAEDLKDHVETLRINVRDGDRVESLEINVPDARRFPSAEDDRRSLSHSEARYLLFVSSVATNFSTAVPACRSPFRPSPIIDRLRTGTVIAFTPER